ncbi:hypothetical protein WJX72_011320 [[Myrmecia] bisecta]|uniref:Putative gamma-glutamylcyclotransferase n=1 Tax=[Myrmecia] bisecta TaxID=41462 RepID=A0AAW1QSX9_9CHLO
MAPNSTVFVYGTLLAHEILHILLKRVPDNKPAVLHGYRRYRIKQRVYPALVKRRPGDSVQGLVLFDLTPQEIEILDEYEDEDYFKDAASPVLEDGNSVDADVYLFKDNLRHLLYGDWDYDQFRREDLARYIKDYDEGSIAEGNARRSAGV